MTVVTGRHRRPASPALQGAVVVACWLVVLAAAPRARTAGAVHDVALFVHLGAMVAGFGAVLLVDWFGLLWLAGRRTFADVLRTAQGAHVPIWAGFAGLLVSGLFLGLPADLKSVAVLVVGLNGVYAGRLLHELSRHPEPPRALLARSAAVTVLSQLAWWTALVLGYLTSRPG
ncbi:hypothetical protein [Actinoplanes awajinensis]|uniref:Uncharacterized protein n=1 Tax=Actinoplanes awajinensis subsp. mycoplanecinus TaxID=135947 RepID=A0A0X3UQ56_9ACTN|nr:hypothetical protein [Actinoplanes awajinensis]KUL34277.1 hypothetical protein ADL15_16725 [Actinoplanes awajinensis subsp. mycoplanecinus]